MSVLVIGAIATAVSGAIEEIQTACHKANVNRRRNRSYQRFDPKRR